MADAQTHPHTQPLEHNNTPTGKQGRPAFRRCRATTKRGTPCTREATPSGLCVVHDPERLAEANRKRSETARRRTHRDGWTKADLVLPEKPTLKDVMRVQAAVTALLAEGEIQKETAYNILGACKQDIQILGSKALEKASDKAATQIIDVAALSRQASEHERVTGQFTRERRPGGGLPPNSTLVTSNPSELVPNPSVEVCSPSWSREEALQSASRPSSQSESLGALSIASEGPFGVAELVLRELGG